MGDDGHTASIFPNDEASILANSTSELIAITNAPNHPKRRITCSTFLLKNAKHTYLLFTGDNKKVILEEENGFLRTLDPLVQSKNKMIQNLTKQEKQELDKNFKSCVNMTNCYSL